MMMYDNYTTDNFLNGKVIGEFVCDKIHSIHVPSDIRYCLDFGIWSPLSERLLHNACITPKEALDYADNKEFIFGWHISDLKIYDKPKELSDFKKLNRQCYYADLGYAKPTCLTCRDTDCMLSKPPQSWCYVEKERKSNDG